MSDTSFTAVSSSLERTQIYDDEWMMDNLSDDGKFFAIMDFCTLS